MTELLRANDDASAKLLWKTDGLQLLEVQQNDVLVHELVLAREPANEIGISLLADLEAALAILSEPERGVRALVISSSLRRGFCAGADLRGLFVLNELGKTFGYSLRDRKAGVRSFLLRIHAFMNALDQAPFFSVSAVRGVVLGGGFELALATDAIVADPSARFGFPELRLGLIPGFGGIPRLERDLGNAPIRELLFSGRTWGAKRAYDLGVVSQIAATGKERELALRLAEQASRFDQNVFARAKRFTKPLPVARLHEEIETFVELFGTEAFDRGLSSFASSTSAMPYLPSKQAALAPSPQNSKKGNLS